jgi:hypothetical protein
MPNIKYGKALTITNMQVIIIKIWLGPRQIYKIRCNMLIRTSVRKPIYKIYWGSIVERKIGIKLLSIALKWRIVKG